MKSYPSIPHITVANNLPCIAFDKLDGSNLRFEYSRKRGWYKYGTRTRLFDRSDKIFGQAVQIFLDKYGQSLAGRWNNFIAYGEYLGPHSFAGHHRPSDKMDVVLFDVNIHKKGLLSQWDFRKLFGHIHIPRIVYEGKLSQDFIDDVRAGCYNVNEGVVIKGGQGHDLWMGKVKTRAYLDKLKLFGYTEE
jgi:hypothetical protein